MSARAGTSWRTATWHSGVAAAIVGAALLIFTQPPADASLHKCIDAGGKITYSDALCPGSRHSERPPPTTDNARRITSEQIKAMIAASDEATRRMDLDKIMSYYAEDATIEMVTRVGHRTGRQFMRKKELAAIAKRHKDDVTEYHMRREKLAIDIASSGMQAETRSTVIEDWRQNGQSVTMTSEEQNLIELRDGRLQIVHSYVISDGGPRERR
jgi:ketosteroid isomerase-like protein